MAGIPSGARRYLLELASVIGAYAVVLLGSISWLKAGIDSPWLRAGVAMSPMIPGACTIWVVMRQLGRIDELMRKIQFEALALAFAGTALVTFSYGFLEGIGLPRLSMFMVWPLMAVLWVVGVCVGNWRYRNRDTTADGDDDSTPAGSPSSLPAGAPAN